MARNPVPTSAVNSQVPTGEDPNWYVDAATSAVQNQPPPDTTPWNADTRPVVIGQNSTPLPTSSISITPDTIDRGPNWNVTTVYQGMNYLSWVRGNDPEAYAAILSQLRAAGYLGRTATAMSSVNAAWYQLLDDSANRYGNMTNQSADVFSFLNYMATEGAPDDPSGGGGGSYGGGAAGPTASVDLTDPGTAKIILDQALTQYLGRKANEKEIARFTKALRAEQMDNPNTVTISPDGTTAIRDGGMNPAAFAEDYALRKEGSAEFRAVTSYVDTFLSSLRAPVEV